jgi:hypothetical protein
LDVIHPHAKFAQSDNLRHPNTNSFLGAFMPE